MEQVNEKIKKEFDDKLKNIEEIDYSKKRLINSLCYTVVIVLFVCVSIGTVISVKNYIEAKKQQEERNNIPTVTLSKID